MPRKPKKWPSYALWALEDSLALLREIGDLSREAQKQIHQNNRLEAVILVGDIRDKAQRAANKLMQGKLGQYEQEEQP